MIIAKNKRFVEIYVREQTVIPILRRNSVIQKGIQLWEKSTKVQLLPQQNAAQNHHRTENQSRTLLKTIIALKTNGRKASYIEASINQWLSQVPSYLFKSITFDCGKEFSNWKSISNAHDIDIFFAGPYCPGQRGLNEHSNGLLRQNGQPK